MGIKQREIQRKKALAEEAFRKNPNLSITEIQNLSGVSRSTAQRVRTAGIQNLHKSTLPQSKPVEEDDTSSTALDFEDTPEPVDDTEEKQSLVDKGFDTIKGLLGIQDAKKTAGTAPPLSAKLDPKRQAFVDNVSPTVSLAFMLCASYMWGRIGPQYKVLAPDETVAQRITEPLVRIYARHASFLTEVNPDWADAGASVFALIGYVYTSLGLYQQIREQEAANEETDNISNFRDYRAGTRAESTANNQDNRRASLFGAAHGNVSGAYEEFPRSASNVVGRSDLTAKEQKQYAALSRLSELDYLSRARRSGTVR